MDSTVVEGSVVESPVEESSVVEGSVVDSSVVVPRGVEDDISVVIDTAEVMMLTESCLLTVVKLAVAVESNVVNELCAESTVGDCDSVGSDRLVSKFVKSVLNK